MNQRPGRAYLFVRWLGFASTPARLGEVGWAFEYIDRLGRFVGFHCGASSSRTDQTARAGKNSWSERCNTIPELIKLMASDGAERPGYDEAKVFEAEDADPDAALQVVQRISDEVARVRHPLEETREILVRYGARGLAPSKGFSAPFLWYNILPGRSVPIRKLPVHLLQLKALAEGQGAISSEEVEDLARRRVQSVAGVRSLGECFVARIRTGFLVAMDIALDSWLPVSESYRITQQVDQAIHSAHQKIRHVFVQVIPFEGV